MISVGNIQFRANAKLMLTGEYLVLNGADALAIPLKFSQALEVSEHSGTPALQWKTYVNGQHWFDVVFSLTEFVIGNSNDFPTAQNLREILISAKMLNPFFLEKMSRYEVVSELDFDISWGLGSSSSLIANIAHWAGVDPFDLYRKVSVGSGYDLFTSLSAKPILYRVKNNVPYVQEVNFFPVFHEGLYFAYLGRKRSSAKAIKDFRTGVKADLDSRIQDINLITNAMISATELREFRKLMQNHEKIISGILGVPPLGLKHFSDFEGDIKSLGAWGGDYILLATDMPREYVASWLRKKDLNTWFAYEDIALNPFK